MGIEIPSERSGQAVPEPAGASFAASLHDAEATSTHPEQYYEMIGHRGFYRDGWSAVTCRQPRTAFSEESWELHHLAADPTESRDLAGEQPEKLAELRQAWEDAAWANQVYPLDEGNAVKMIEKPPWTAELAVTTRLLPGMPTVERWRALQLIFQRDFVVRVELDWQPGDAGVLVAHGDQGGGYSLCVEDDHGWFAFNGYGAMTVLDLGALAAGTAEVTLAMANPAPGVWDARVAVDGEAAGEAAGLPQLFAMAPFEGIDVGIDRRSPVSWDVYERHGPFPYSGRLTAVTYEPGDLVPHSGEAFLDMLKDAGRAYE